MKNYCIVYISQKGYLCECQVQTNSQKNAIKIFNSIKKEKDEVLYVCLNTCKITEKSVLPILVSIDKIRDVVIELKNNE